MAVEPQQAACGFGKIGLVVDNDHLEPLHNEIPQFAILNAATESQEHLLCH
jgi:hypothetical protein